MATLAKMDANLAVITTATVEIKTLRISNRQVTQSLFKQIPLEKIPLTAQFEIKDAVLWGRVNYYWEGSENSIHVLWQKENELRRAYIPKDVQNVVWYGDIVSRLHTMGEIFKQLNKNIDGAFFPHLLGLTTYQKNFLENVLGIGVDKAQNKKEVELWLPRIEASIDSLSQRMVQIESQWGALIYKLNQLEQLFIAG